MPLSNRIIFIVGPTAVGKTEVAYCLAQKINGEIISCDSMQVYKKISIVNSKPNKKYLKEIPHHLIDIVSVGEEFDAAQFRDLALQAIEKILNKKKVPIIVGGSGMYMSILLDGIFEGAGKDKALRQELEQEALELGNEILYARLKAVDREAAAKIHPNDRRRMIRALEVFHMHRQPISKLQKKRSGLWGKYDIRIFALNLKRTDLYARINQRVEEMFANGLVEEVKGLDNLHLSPTANCIIGIKEIRGYLNGEYDLSRAKDLIKLNTRHFAKRQLTWYRKDKRVEWIEIGKDDEVKDVLEKLLNKLD